MNKQEFQKTIRNMEPPKHFSALTFKEAFNEGFNSAKNNALFNSCFLNEPEKPVVPKYVADWYEENKDDLEYNLYKLCIDFHEQKLRADLYGWFNDDNNKSIETLVLMHKFGYEVEKEKLYTVEMPNPNSDDHLVLRKNIKGNVCVSLLHREYWRGYESTQLTEAEIKQDFDWAWQFAKEVDE